MNRNPEPLLYEQFLRASLWDLLDPDSDAEYEPPGYQTIGFVVEAVSFADMRFQHGGAEMRSYVWDGDNEEPLLAWCVDVVMGNPIQAPYVQLAEAVVLDHEGFSLLAPHFAAARQAFIAALRKEQRRMYRVRPFEEEHFEDVNIVAVSAADAERFFEASHALPFGIGQSECLGDVPKHLWPKAMTPIHVEVDSELDRLVVQLEKKPDPRKYVQ